MVAKVLAIVLCSFTRTGNELWCNANLVRIMVRNSDCRAVIAGRHCVKRQAERDQETRAVAIYNRHSLYTPAVKIKYVFLVKPKCSNVSVMLSKASSTAWSDRNRFR